MIHLSSLNNVKVMAFFFFELEFISLHFDGFCFVFVFEDQTGLVMG